MELTIANLRLADSPQSLRRSRELPSPRTRAQSKSATKLLALHEAKTKDDPTIYSSGGHNPSYRTDKPPAPICIEYKPIVHCSPYDQPIVNSLIHNLILGNF